MKSLFRKRDCTSWSYKLYTIIQLNDDTIPSYRIKDLPGGYDEKFSRKSKLSVKENNDVLKKLKMPFNANAKISVFSIL